MNIRHSINVGDKFGLWEIIDNVADYKAGNQLFTVRCECGEIEKRQLSNLIHQKVKCCVNCQKENKRAHWPKKGEVIGNWTVIGIDELNKRAKIICQCKCGFILNKRPENLLGSGHHECSSCHFKSKRAQYFKKFKYIPHFLFTQIKCNAKIRNLEFNLDVDYLDNLLENQDFKCAISGIKLQGPIKLTKDNGRGGYDRDRVTMSLDRIDSSIGYIQNNVQWVHKWVNVMKGAMQDDYFITLCKIIAENNQYSDKIELDTIYNNYKFGITNKLN